MNKKIPKNLFILIDDLIVLEKKHGIQFNEKGLPIFTKEMFADSIPSLMRPYSHRKDTTKIENTSVVFFEPDSSLYRRLSLAKLETTAIELSKYHSFVGFDLSIFNDYLYPFQAFYILVNLVIDMFFIIKGNNLKHFKSYGRRTNYE